MKCRLSNAHGGAGFRAWRIDFVLALLFVFVGTNAGGSFHFTNVTDNSLALFEGARRVFVYNHGIIHQPGVPEDRARSSYVHPLYGLDGEVLTDDFPRDHYHHRGLFWAWPHVRIGKQHYDLWMIKGIEQRFERWLAREAGVNGATLGIENGWYVGERKVMQERVWLRASPSAKDERTLDVELTWSPVGDAITLEGAEGKSYGGLTLRFAARTNTVITTPLGQGKEDLTITRLPWADLSAQFAGRKGASGVAIFVAPDHPDFPPEWLTRHYGVLCLGWPGVKAKTFQPGDTIRCRYRIWIHRGTADVEKVKRAYHAYAEPASPMTLAVDESRGELKALFKGQPLLVYAFATNQFKPYIREIYSLNGINVLRDAPADHLHHHGLMYAIRVNGVNFWEEQDQPGVQKSVRLLDHRTGRDAHGRPQASFTHLIHWITSSNRWITDTERVALLVERRTIIVTVDEPSGEVALRWQAAFEAGRSAVKLHGSAYNGLGLRLPEAFDHAARHINSEQTPYTAEQKWDVTAATWSAVSHAYEGREVMVALFSRPTNKGETRFFTMLNPFAYLSVTQNLEKLPIEYAAGERFTIDYLLTVYSEKKSPKFLHQRQRLWQRSNGT